MKHKDEFDKPFKRGDIVLYAVLAAIVLTLFLVAWQGVGTSGDGFEISVSGKTVATFDFSTNQMKVESGFEGYIEKISDSTYRIVTENGYNTIEIDGANKSVKVVEADCGRSKECMHMNLGSNIICVPHGLVIKLSSALDDLKIG